MPEASSAALPPLDARDRDFRERPNEVIDTLRASGTVHHDVGRDRLILLGAKEVVGVLADRTLSSDPYNSSPAAAAARGVRPGRQAQRTLFELDDPDHARLRGLVSQAFTARAVERLRPRVNEIASALLDGIDGAEPFDLMQAFAVPFPILVMAEMLGIAPDAVGTFRRHVEEFALLLAPAANEEELRRWQAVNAALDALFREMIAERLQTPRDDLVGALVSAKKDREALNETEIVNTCKVLLIAGDITSADLIGNGAVALLQAPEQLVRLRADPGLWPAAVEEVLRYDSPVVAIHRQVTTPHEVGGRPTTAGQTLTCMLGAANHDPGIHSHPHRFNLDRQPQQHVSFGGGAHFCLGASLARMEGQIALEALFTRFPRLELAANRPLQHKALPNFSGYRAVWLQAV